MKKTKNKKEKNEKRKQNKKEGQVKLPLDAP
jgi:hypothetical protein